MRVSTVAAAGEVAADLVVGDEPGAVVLDGQIATDHAVVDRGAGVSVVLQGRTFPDRCFRHYTTAAVSRTVEIPRDGATVSDALVVATAVYARKVATNEDGCRRGCAHGSPASVEAARTTINVQIAANGNRRGSAAAVIDLDKVAAFLSLHGALDNDIARRRGDVKSTARLDGHVARYSCCPCHGTHGAGVSVRHDDILVRARRKETAAGCRRRERHVMYPYVRRVVEGH